MKVNLINYNRLIEKDDQNFPRLIVIKNTKLKLYKYDYLDEEYIITVDLKKDEILEVTAFSHDSRSGSSIDAFHKASDEEFNIPLRNGEDSKYFNFFTQRDLNRLNFKKVIDE